jgi:hypothetical protein
MPHYAKLVDNTIVNVIVAETKEDAEQLIGTPIVEIPSTPDAPGAGYIWDGENFSKPPAQVLEETPAE